MAIRELKCNSCGFEFEEIVKELDSEPGVFYHRGPGLDPVTCPKCESRDLERKLSASGFQLKGLGWTGKIRKS
jgi:predicted nucleic acid-binding Zn ribbon protein